MRTTKKDGTPTIQFIKFMRDCHNRYIISNIDNIFKAYYSPSQTKIDVFNYWKRTHSNSKIISYNTSFFTVAFIDKVTGYFTVITPNNHYFIDTKYINPLMSL